VPDGQVVVTAAPLRPGRRVAEGDRLVEVSGRPAFLLHGATPMYRNLRYGVTGPDVLQLQLALARLGFRPGDRSGWFGPGTEAAVRRFYRARGYQPAIEPVDRVTGEPVPGGAAQASAFPRRLLWRLAVPWSELVFVRHSPTWVVSAPFSVGQRPDRPVLTLATGSPSVAVSLNDHEWGLVRRGARIMVEPGRGAARLDTTISSVEAAPVAAPGTPGPRGGEPGEGVALLKTSLPLPVAYVGRPVKVTVEAQRTAGEVLTVPLAAMWSRADGTLHVTVASVDGTREVWVVPGVSVDGMVEVIPAGGMLSPGDLVVIGDRARG
jgi:peptidoglycan hydrolase-like protein with peptidoglycan-binding domain